MSAEYTVTSTSPTFDVKFQVSIRHVHGSAGATARSEDNISIKGIPDPRMTIQFMTAVNNITEEKFTSLQNNPGYTQQFINAYNTSGYPETTTINAGTGQDNLSIVTHYSYQDCP